VRAAAREQVAQWAAVHPRGTVAADQTSTDAPVALRAGARTAAVPPMAAAAQTGTDAPMAGSMEIAAFTGGVTLPCQASYGEERAVEKLFRCILEKYKQIARSIESLLDLSTMSIEEAIGRIKVVDDDKSQPLSGPISVGGKLHLTRE
jgi:hypothetical protein